MTDKEKALEIAKNDALYGEDPDNNSKTDECYIAALAMAAWKEQQMIEKAVEWINIHMLYNASESYKKEIIENFKKYMEEN